jgi:hypothetical protein
VYPDIVSAPKAPPPPVAPVEASAGLGLQLDLTA